MATRGPAGSGWPARRTPASTSSVTVSTRITPAWRSSADTAASGTRVTGTAWPGGVEPLWRAPFTATTGFTAAVRRASRVNFRGLPIDSRYSRTTSVSASSYQYWRMSLPETSARLPDEMNVDRPAPRRCRPDRSAIPIAPDWVKRPIRPRCGGSGASEALSRVPGAVLMTPNAFGPISRIPYDRTCRSSSRWRSRPAAPLSAYPADRTTKPCTPCSPHSATASGTRSAGTARTARSTCSEMSPSERTPRTPSIREPSSGNARLTAYARPVNPAPSRLRSTVRPTPPGARPVPITATEPGASSRCTERASARCSRARCTASDSAVGSRSSVRWTEPSSKERFC